MEIPKFVNSKAARFSSAVLALTIIACNGDENHAPAEPTHQEQNVITADVLIGALTEQNIDESTLDHSCGIFLGDGDTRQFRIPTNTPPLDIDFQLEVARSPDGDLIVGGMVVSQPVYFGAKSPGNTDAVPLGYLIPFTATGQVFFSPFAQSRQYLVDGCAPNT